MSDWITIARYPTPVEANLARGRLEVEGIRATLANELSVLSGFGGAESIELQVAPIDVERASAILRERPESTPEDDWARQDPVERCLVCQSSFVEVESLPLPLRLLRSLIGAALPLPDGVFASRRRVCGVCGYHWRAGEGVTTRAPETWRG